MAGWFTADTACPIAAGTWLAARAENVGVGWVSILRYDDLRAALGIPPLPLSARQTGELIELLKAGKKARLLPPQGEGDHP